MAEPVGPGRSGKDVLVRGCFRSGGYAYARSAAEISRQYGHGKIARLASNENPYPPSGASVEAGIAALKGANRYPDERTASFRDALREFHGDYSFVTGVGMDGVIETTIRTLVEPGDRVAVSTPTFSFYRLAAVAQCAEVVEVPRRKDFSVDPDAFVKGAEGAKISFLCSPNNPTGNAIPAGDVETILGDVDGILFLDNAYVEFSGLEYRPLMRKYDNLIIGRTMSKAYSLAGLRVGYAFVPPWFAEYYLRAATPHTLNSVSASAAAAAFRDEGHVQEIVGQVRKWRPVLAKECRYPVFPSDANFVMIDTRPFTSEEMVGKLAEAGVLVRSCRSFRGLDDHYIRVNIGEDWEMERFLGAINGIR